MPWEPRRRAGLAELWLGDAHGQVITGRGFVSVAPQEDGGSVRPMFHGCGLGEEFGDNMKILGEGFRKATLQTEYEKVHGSAEVGSEI